MYRRLSRSRNIPFYFIVLYLVLEYTRISDLVPPMGKVHLPMIINISILISYFYYHIKFNTRPQTILLIIFLIIIAKNIPFARNNYWVFKTTKDFSLLLFCFYFGCLTFVTNRTELEIITDIWVGLGIFLSIWVITHGGVGPAGFLADENDAALALNIFLPSAYFKFLNDKKMWKKIYHLMVTGFCLAGVIGTFSRGGFVGLIPVLAFCWYFTPRKKVATTVVIILVIFFIIVSPAKYWKEMKTITDPNELTAKERREYWALAIDMFLDHPFMGIGAQNYPWNAGIYDDQFKITANFGGRAAHSLYFSLLCELAIPGVIVFFLLIYYNLKDALWVRKIYQCRVALLETYHKNIGIEFLNEITFYYYFTLSIIVSLIGYLFSGLFLSVLYYSHFYILTTFLVLSNLFVQKSLLKLYNSDEKHNIKNKTWRESIYYQENA